MLYDALAGIVPAKFCVVLIAEIFKIVESDGSEKSVGAPIPYKLISRCSSGSCIGALTSPSKIFIDPYCHPPTGLNKFLSKGIF